MKINLLKKYQPVATYKSALPSEALWNYKITEIFGHNIETKGRVVVNRLLKEGWILLHIYNLRYEKNGITNERPMAILGKPEPVGFSTVPNWLNNE
jgi:hypothetical protein